LLDHLEQARSQGVLETLAAQDKVQFAGREIRVLDYIEGVGILDRSQKWPQDERKPAAALPRLTCSGCEPESRSWRRARSFAVDDPAAEAASHRPFAISARHISITVRRESPRPGDLTYPKGGFRQRHRAFALNRLLNQRIPR
jgi:hypothetical protein